MPRSRATKASKAAAAAASSTSKDDDALGPSTSSASASASASAPAPPASQRREEPIATTTTTTEPTAEPADPESEAADAESEAAISSLLELVILQLLFSSASAAWNRQFAPIHGSASISFKPEQTLMYDSAVALLLYNADLPARRAGFTTVSGVFPLAPWLFLAVALLQPLQFHLGGLLGPISAALFDAAFTRALSLLAFQPALTRAWTMLDADGASPVWMLRGVRSLVYLLATLARPLWPIGDPLGGWLVATLPSYFLPETWAASLVVTAIASSRAAIGFVRANAAKKEAAAALLAAAGKAVAGEAEGTPAKKGSGKKGKRSSAVEEGGGSGGGGAKAGKTRAPIVVFAACVLPVLHGLVLNTHSPVPLATTQLQAALSPSGFTLIDRADGGGSGYVSVLHSEREGYKVLRAGHSLLGGVFDRSAGAFKEPIYAVFVMLEAVRLMLPQGTSKRKIDKDSSALVIGLGIGTAPAAFIHHGINTTIVEFDRVVYDFAVSHFDLPSNHIPIIDDAVGWVARNSRPSLVSTGVDSSSKPDAASEPNPPALQYDYILHDVFTGGVEPAELFTYEFLSGLRRLLKPDGSVAINYAGDLSLPTPNLVLRTILAVFDGTCRIFREFEGPESLTGSDQTNVVVFCRKDGRPFTFAKPSAEDLLGTQCRKLHLVPKHEMKVEPFSKGVVVPAESGLRSKLDLQDRVGDGDGAGNGNGDGNGQDEETALLYDANVAQLAGLQREAGVAHWKLMREVIPAAVWINW